MCVQLLIAQIVICIVISGTALADATYTHPLKDVGMRHRLLEANHVTAEKGTGLVHTAPAHGVEDFQIALEHGLPMVIVNL